MSDTSCEEGPRTLQIGSVGTRLGAGRWGARLAGRWPLAACLLVVLGIGVPTAEGQTPARRDSTAADSTKRKATPLQQVTITATRTAKDVFDAPAAVSVIDSATLQRRLLF